MPICQLPIFSDAMGQSEDHAGRCHISKGLMKLCHRRHLQEGGSGGNALGGAMLIIAALLQESGDNVAIFKERAESVDNVVNDMEGYVSWWFRRA